MVVGRFVLLKYHGRDRPVGMVKIAVVEGRGLISPDLNLPGNAYVSVTYVPDG